MGVVGKLVLISTVVSAVWIGIKFNDFTKELPPPQVPTDVWWGPGERVPQNESITPFRIFIHHQVLTSLKHRLTTFLEQVRIPPLEEVGFEYGFNPKYLQTVVRYWRDAYDWRAAETRLNRFDQFTTYVNGLNLHYYHVVPKKEKGKKIVPILLLHGWPSSARDFLSLIPYLTHSGHKANKFSFEVVAPNLPGFGFSEAPAKKGMGAVEVAVVLNNLMAKIGINKYYVHGGDWGAIIGSHLAALYPETVLGLHSNLCVNESPYAHVLGLLGTSFPWLVAENELERERMFPYSKWLLFWLEESGYYHMQATKPFTIGSALADSPAGLLAYMLEKYSTGTNQSYRKLPDGGLTKKFSLDASIDNVMIYWVTGSITSAFYLYAEHYTPNQLQYKMNQVPVTVPTGCARFENEIAFQAKSIISRKFKNVVHLTDYENCGHFVAMECTEVLASDIFKAVRKFRQVS